MWARIASIAIGLWLMAAPAVFGYVQSAAEFSDRIAGPLAATFAAIAVGQSVRAVRLWNVPVGAFLVIAPLLFDYPLAGAINAVLSGVALIALCAVRGRVSERFGGGWRALRDPERLADRS